MVKCSNSYVNLRRRGKNKISSNIWGHTGLDFSKTDTSYQISKEQWYEWQMTFQWNQGGQNVVDEHL